MAVAAALLDGEVLIDQFSEKRINSDDVWDLIDRTKTQKAYDQLPVDERLTTRVRLTLKDGSTRERLVAALAADFSGRAFKLPGFSTFRPGG
jgi:aconitate decarboxylase